MKEQRQRSGQRDERKRSSARPLSQADATAELAAFDHHGDSLNREEQRRPPVSGSSRNRDDQIVNEAADREAGQDAGARSESCREWLEEISIREIPKGRIPSAPPE